MAASSVCKYDLKTAIPRTWPKLQLARAAGGKRSKAKTVGQRLVRVGSAPNMEVRIQNEDVSPLHALLITTERKVWILDLSQGGTTRRNGEPVGRATLADGDTLQFGSVEVTVTLRAGRHDEAPPVTTQPTLTDPETGWAASLDGDVILIGSDARADVQLADEQVLPLHAVVVRYQDGHALFTIDAEQTVDINDVPVHSGMIKPGDRVRLGQQELVVAETAIAPDHGPGDCEGISTQLTDALADVANRIEGFERHYRLALTALDAKREELATECRAFDAR
ncbi:MAG: FHA domain-containing protein, partial [Chloroflexi bacterium]|nr:FHA domain-containing protein [Chloroflexota bacterium]